MSAKTTIEWATRTWNPVRGCSRVSPGCDNCYAMKQAHRFAGPGKPYEGLTTLRKKDGAGWRVDWSGSVRVIPDEIDAPLRWKKPERIFVNSMSDLFHPSLDLLTEVRLIFTTMLRAPQHTFMVLTKRPARMREFALRLRAGNVIGNPSGPTLGLHGWKDNAPLPGSGSPFVLPNVWLGVSVEDQQRAYERIPPLLETPAAVRFLSCEPLLGPVDLRDEDWTTRDYLRGTDSLQGVTKPLPGKVDWVIVGGESGAGARPMQLDWMRSIVQQCRDAGTACFVKQFGARPMFSQTEGYSRAIRGEAGRLLDRKGGDLTEIQGDWPREFPR